MQSLKWIRDHPDLFDAGLQKRGLSPLSAVLLAEDEKRRALQTEVQALQNHRNTVAKAIGERKKKGENAEDLFKEAADLKVKIPAIEHEILALSDTLHEMMAPLPNVPLEDVPLGEDESDNQIVRTWGKQPTFDFPPQSHYTLGENLGLMDFEGAAKLSGARFVVLKGDLARLERALATFMLDVHTQEHGYQEVNVPYLVRDNALFGTGNLPKFGDDLFKTGHDLWLIPTAEVPVTNLGRESIYEEKAFPIRYVSHTPCFRSEAGSAGRDTRGMIRMHQFHKVELVSLTTPEQTAQEHEYLTGCAEAILKKLELPYQVSLLCTGDMGATAAKTYDLEVWLPGEGLYREISSCSRYEDYQARRMDGRYRPEDPTKGKTSFFHTLNGSALAVGRTLVAVLENYQQADGSVRIPEALRPYMQNQEVIKKNDNT